MHLLAFTIFFGIVSSDTFQVQVDLSSKIGTIDPFLFGKYESFSGLTNKEITTMIMIMDLESFIKEQSLSLIGASDPTTLVFLLITGMQFLHQIHNQLPEF